MTTLNPLASVEGQNAIATAIRETGTNIINAGISAQTSATAAAESATSAASSATNAATSATSAAASVTEAETIKNEMLAGYGYPFTAATAADMTDTTKIYVYTGSETGYTFGDWYYHNGTAWTDGGVYNAMAFNTDPTLTVPGAAADAKVVGEKFAEIVTPFSNSEGYYEKKLTLNSIESGTIDSSGNESASSKAVRSDFIYAESDGICFNKFSTSQVYVCEYSSASQEGFVVRHYRLYDDHVDLIKGKYYRFVVLETTSITTDIEKLTACSHVAIYFKCTLSELAKAVEETPFLTARTVNRTMHSSEFTFAIIDTSTGEIVIKNAHNRLSTSDLVPAHHGVTISITNNAVQGYVYKYDVNGNYLPYRVGISYGNPITISSGYFAIQLSKTNGNDFTASDGDFATYSGYISLNYITTYGAIENQIEEGTMPANHSLIVNKVKNFMDSDDYDSSDYSYTQVTDYLSGATVRSDQSIPVTIPLTNVSDAERVQLWLSKNSNFSNYDIYDVPAGTRKFPLYNLIPNTTYYYKFVCGYADGSSSNSISGSFTTQNNQTRMLKIDGIQNVRDVGGYSVGNGTVKYGMIIRGSAMDETVASNLCITESGKVDLLKYLKIGTDLDLRTGFTESALGNNVAYYAIGSGSYANFDASNVAMILSTIVNSLNNAKPVYIHCQGGCDRTGTTITLLLGLLGVSESDLAKEYELSCFSKIGGGRYRTTNNPSAYNYIGLINRIKAYSGSTLQEKFESIFLEGGATQATINSFKNIMVE